MQIAIVGLAGAGKTTVFNTLTRGHAETGGYGGLQLNVGGGKGPGDRAGRLGQEIADLVDDPEAFLDALRARFADLTDETYRREQARVAPGLEDSVGIRLPLLSAVRRSFDRHSNWAGADSLLALPFGDREAIVRALA